MLVEDSSAWLPSTVTLSQFNGCWEDYCEALYQGFRTDFLCPLPAFLNQPMRLKKHPLSSGKEATFWHLISEGKSEADRLPCMFRCARLCWVRPMIDAVGSNRVLAWVEDRPEKAVIIAVPDFSFKVVIARRNGYFLPWTAYYLERQHQRDKLSEGFKRFKGSLE